MIIQPTPNIHFHNNNSLRLDGINDHMQIDTVCGDVSVSVGTFSAWVKKESTESNDLIMKFDADSSNHISVIYLNSTNKMRFSHKAGGTAKTFDVDFEYEGDNNWYHISQTWDTDADEFKGYINGVQVGETKSSLGTWSGTVDAADVGKNSVSDNSYWTGYIDQVSIFTSVVSASTLYNGGTPGNLNGMSNLVSWYQFNEGSGTSIADSSGTGNTGTLVNGAAFNTDTP